MNITRATRNKRKTECEQGFTPRITRRSRQSTLLTRRLDLALHRTARCRVGGPARDDHGVRHGQFRVVDHQTLRFGETEGDVERVLRSGAMGC